MRRIAEKPFTFSMLVASILALALPARAQQDLTGANVVSYDFAGFTGAGFSPTPSAGQLDSDEWIARGVQALNLSFGDTSANADFMNGTSPGGVPDGGIWAFTPVPRACGSGSRTLLGAQPSTRTFTPGSFRVRVRNATGAALDAISLEYTFAYLNDAGRSVVHTVRVLQVDDTGAETGRVDVTELRVETPVAAAAAPEWVSTCQSAMIDLSSIPIADGAFFVVSFDFDDGTGLDARDEIGITDVRIGTMAFPDGGVPHLDAGVLADAGAMADAGARVDASVMMDAGAAIEDAGAVSDAATPADAGLDAGTSAPVDSGSIRRDAAMPGSDGGTGVTEGGCGCSAPGGGPSAPSCLVGLAVVALLRARARRRAEHRQERNRLT